MSKQNYKNHIRWYPPHHYFLYPLSFLVVIACMAGIFTHPDNRLEWIILSLLSIMLCCLSFMVRQHYALNNQNRIVRLEMRFRYYLLTQKRFESVESQLSFGQIAALRFAGDEELPELVQRAIKEKMTPDAIKRAIVNWLPDKMRA